MIEILESMLSEFQEEVVVTRRVLQRVPSEKLAWRPHSKSMSLGQLADHLVTFPGVFARILQLGWFDASKASPSKPPAKTTEEILVAFEQSVREVEECLEGMTEEQAQGSWRLTFGEKELFRKPRFKVLRSQLLNHWYHHRGQISVYLRLLEIPVPAIYGPSADENPYS